MKRLFIASATILLIITAITTMTHQPRSSGTTITPEEVFQDSKSDTNLVFLDVRTREEFMGASGHLRSALLIPIQELEKRIGELAGVKQRKIVAYCRTGHRSGIATDLLTKRGFTVVNMEGGIVRWNELQYPVVREPRP